MAFQISETGSKEAVAAVIAAVKSEPTNPFASFRQGVIDDIAKLGPEFNGAHVDLLFEDNGQSRKFHANIIGKKLAI